MKKGTIIKIVKSNPIADQDQLDINNYIGLQLPVLARWKQSSDELENGEIQVELPNEGVAVLNRGEYQIVR